jgi:hypothetical protein
MERMTEAGYSREEVYARMLRNAGEMWGLHSSELEALDPLVRLLLGSMAKEVEKLGNDLHSSDTRIFRRIAQYLMPDARLFAQPAHGVVRLEPAGPQDVTRYDELSFEKQWRNKDDLNRQESMELGFTAVGTYHLDGPQAVCRAMGDGLYAIERLRTPLMAQLGATLAPGEVYLGFAQYTDETRHISLYFDWLSDAARDDHFRTLHKVTAFNMRNEGLHVSRGSHPENAVRDLRTTTDPIAGLEERTRIYYDERFLRIGLDAPLPAGAPPVVEQALAKTPLAQVEDMRWIRLVFPSEFDARQVRESIILDNCVPVVNRRLRTTVYRLHKEFNIKLLETEGWFQGIEKAESSGGQKYAEVPSLDMVDVSPGTYAMRLGTAGRFDQRDGTEFMNHMIDLLREERRSFAAMDAGSTLSDLRSIEQLLERMGKRLSGQEGTSGQRYIMIKPFTAAENAHVYYWTTDGEQANDLPAGTRLMSRNAGLASSGGITLVSTTVGARNELDPKETVQLYKSMVLSRGVILTRQDIIEHCKYAGSSELEDVTVEEGVMVSPDHARGLIRCLDVRLKFLPNRTDPQTMERVRRRITADLSASAGSSLPIRVI